MRATQRLGAGVSATALVLIAAAAGEAATTADTAKDKRESQAQSQAVIARLVPFVGLPGVTTNVGIVTSQVGGGTAQSSAAAADFGLLGTLVTAGAGGATADIPGAELPTLPAPISADSEGTRSVTRDPFADTGAGAAAGSPGFLAQENVNAQRKPLQAQSTVLGPTLALPGVLAMSGARSFSFSDAAGSSSEVVLGQLSLADGQVLLSGMRWSAGQGVRTAGTAGFTLGGLQVAGQDMPVDSPAEIADGLIAANSSLAPLGIVLTAPSLLADNNGASVAPLVIQVRNPEPLVDPSRQAVAVVSPVVSDLVTQLVEAYPDAQAAQIVTNAVVGAGSGSTGGRIELGGVSARSGQILLEDLTNAVSGPLPNPGGSGQVNEVAAQPETEGAKAVVPAVTDSSIPEDVALIPAAAVPETTISPNVAAFGLPSDSDRARTIALLGLGLALIVLLAAGDRIRMLTGTA